MTTYILRECNPSRVVGLKITDLLFYEYMSNLPVSYSPPDPISWDYYSHEITMSINVKH